jgi:hypothetical protein
MSDIPMIHMFKGKRVDDMTREELIETINFLAEDYHRNNSHAAIQIRSYGRVEMMKRAALGRPDVGTLGAPNMGVLS